jgi:hypothetical protein
VPCSLTSRESCASSSGVHCPFALLARFCTLRLLLPPAPLLWRRGALSVHGRLLMPPLELLLELPSLRFRVFDVS